jgi:hypothetical protein
MDILRLPTCRQRNLTAFPSPYGTMCERRDSAYGIGFLAWGRSRCRDASSLGRVELRTGQYCVHAGTPYPYVLQWSVTSRVKGRDAGL